jgi:murein DD-endopeptidase MepM/ murein hydrolase activator NlpD
METGEFGQPQNFDELVSNDTPIIGGDSGSVQRDAFGNPLSAGPEAMMSYDALLGGDVDADTQEGSTSAGGSGDTNVPSNRHIQRVYGDELITNIPPIDDAIDKIAWAHDTLARKGGELAEDAVPMLQQLRTDAIDKVQDLKGKAVDSWNSPTNQYRINFEKDINELKGIVDEVVQSDLVQRGLKSADQAVKSVVEKIQDAQFGSGILQRLFTPVAEGAIDLLSGAALEAKSGGGPALPADAKEFQGNWYTWRSYELRWGDTLSKLALETLGDGSKAAYEFIAEHNGIQNPDKIYAGMTIELPFAVSSGKSLLTISNDSNNNQTLQSQSSEWQTYIVQRGDTLSGIAGRFMGDSSAAAYNLIAEHNGIADPSKIFVGQVLEVPGSGSSNSSSGSVISSVRNSELAGLSSDDWDRLSGDNTRFDGAIWGGEKDERNLTPDAVKQVYDDLSTALFGQRYRMTAGYLYDRSYFNGRGKWHAGIDIDAPDGTAVKSITSGTVAWVWEGGSRGDFIAIKGDDGREWVYGHLQDKGGFSKGQKVNAGQVIGQIGNQQNASHLHLEVRTGGGSTGGAHADQAFVRDVTMSPLQAFWELQPEPKGSYEENFDARIYEEGSDTPSPGTATESYQIPQKPTATNQYVSDIDIETYTAATATYLKLGEFNQGKTSTFDLPDSEFLSNKFTHVSKNPGQLFSGRKDISYQDYLELKIKVSNQYEILNQVHKDIGEGYISGKLEELKESSDQKALEVASYIEGKWDEYTKRTEGRFNNEVGFWKRISSGKLWSYAINEAVFDTGEVFIGGVKAGSKLAQAFTAVGQTLDFAKDVFDEVSSSKESLVTKTLLLGAATGANFEPLYDILDKSNQILGSLMKGDGHSAFKESISLAAVVSNYLEPFLHDAVPGMANYLDFIGKATGLNDLAKLLDDQDFRELLNDFDEFYLSSALVSSIIDTVASLSKTVKSTNGAFKKIDDFVDKADAVRALLFGALETTYKDQVGRQYQSMTFVQKDLLETLGDVSSTIDSSLLELRDYVESEQAEAVGHESNKLLFMDNVALVCVVPQSN